MSNRTIGLSTLANLKLNLQQDIFMKFFPGVFGLLIFSYLTSNCVNYKNNSVKQHSPKKYNNTLWVNPKFTFLNKESVQVQATTIESEIVLVKNESNTLPINNLNRKIAHLSVGSSDSSFVETCRLFTDLALSVNVSNEKWTASAKLLALNPDLLLVTWHAGKNGDFPVLDLENIALLKSTNKVLLIFGQYDKFKANSNFLNDFSAVILVPENHVLAQNRVAQSVFGALTIQGKLKSKWQNFDQGHGLNAASNGRLKFCNPEELGISEGELKKMDDLAEKGIASGAYPGCQVLAAVDNCIVYRKNFGRHTYDKSSKKVVFYDLYDIASVTKIAASTLLAMELNYQGKYDLDKKIEDYLPELVRNTPYSKVLLKDMMAHQAGFTPWIPYYKKTLTNNKPSPLYYNETQHEKFTLKVAENMYMRTDYVDSMYAILVKTPLETPKKYVYSDLCFYFQQRINERLLGKKQDEYLKESIYGKMGLRHILYNPLSRFEKSQIVPTENEKSFRYQQIHGYVHDQGAAMLGGVGGHAGLFANATDLASVMQLFLNNGAYAGQTFFDEKTTNLFTKQQFSGNKRGAGFDRPSGSGGGTCGKLASQKSFGHSGFTGTLAWADPERKVIFVFLSNRVYPDSKNWKLRDMGIRTSLHDAFYEAIARR